MRLESVFGPDALHTRMADAHLFGHGAHTPVRGVDGTLFYGLLDDLEFDRCAYWVPAGRFGATFHEAFDTGFGEILLPAPNRGLGDANLSHDRHDAMTIRRHDPLVMIEETAEAMHTLFRQGKIRAIGVSNFSIGQMERFRLVAPLHVLQSPYNLFERGIEADVLPYCRNNGIVTFGYGALCRG